MRLVAHIVWKDVHAARGPCLIWTALVLANMVAQIMRMIDGIGVFGGVDRLDSVDIAARLVGIGAVLALVSRVVHADPLVDANAFWLTRPIPRSTLFLSKLIAINLLVAGPPLAIDALVLLAFNVPPDYVARMAFEIWFGSIGALLVLFVAAAITPDLGGFVLLLTGSVASVTVFAAVLISSAGVYPPENSPWVWPNPPRQFFVTSLLVGALVLILRRHYVRRDWEGTLAMTILALAAALILVRVWPIESSLFAAERPPEAAWADPAVTRLRRDGDRMRVTAAGLQHQHDVAVPLVLDGLPDRYTAAPSTVAGQLTYADGTVVRSDGAFAIQVPATATYRPSLMISYDSGPLPPGPTAWEGWPSLIQIPRTVLAGRVGEPGRYVGTLRYRLSHHEPIATLPLRIDATHDDGPRRLDVVDVSDVKAGCHVTLRVSAPARLKLTDLHARALGYHFVDRQTGRLLRVLATGVDRSAEVALHSMSGAVYYTVREVNVSVEDPVTLEDPRAPVLRTCEDTSLIVVRTTPAGTLTRTIELPALRIGPAGQDSLFR